MQALPAVAKWAAGLSPQDFKMRNFKMRGLSSGASLVS